MWADSGHQGELNIRARIPTFVSYTQEKAETISKTNDMNFYRNFVSNLNEPVPGLSFQENTELLARSKRTQRMIYEDFLRTEGVIGDP